MLITICIWNILTGFLNHSTALSKIIVNTSDNDDINMLIDELNTFSLPSANAKKAVQEEVPLKEEDLQQYFLNKTKSLIEAGLGAVQDLTPGIVAGSDSKEIEALSKLMASTAQALDTLQKTALIDKKANRDESLERIRLEGKKEIAQLRQGPQSITNNNILVASREEIMKKLFSKEKEEVMYIDNK